MSAPTPRFEVAHGPSFAMLCVEVGPGTTVTAEAGAMVARAPSVTMQVRLSASRRRGALGKLWAFFVAFVRRLFGGETFFVNDFTAANEGAKVWLAPAMAGAIAHRRLEPNEKLVLSAGAYLASAGELDLRVKFAGLRGVIAREGAFLLEAHGPGDVWFTSYGGIEPIDVDGRYVVDSGHLVGYEGTLTFRVRPMGRGVVGLVASGEGLVCEFEGKGRIYVQARNVSALPGWIAPFLP